MSERLSPLTSGIQTHVLPRPPVARFQSFYFLAALLIAAAVAYGFSQTLDRNLIHASPPRPWMLYLHAATSFVWVALFIAQSALVRTRNVRLHRRIGVGGAVLAGSMSVIGMATSLVMARFNIDHGIRPPDVAAAFLIIPINDTVGFSVSVFLAVRWRRMPEYHRRLMFIATCCLTAAAFARFPFITIDALRWYGGVDLLILLGVCRDLLVDRRVHPVYRYGLPLLVIGQVATMVLFLRQVPAWMAIAPRLVP